jgi:hypothetical protein
MSKNIIQGGANMTGTINVQFTHKSVPVIFEPPYTCTEREVFRPEIWKFERIKFLEIPAELLHNIHSLMTELL